MNKFIPFLLLLLTGPGLSGQVTLEREVIGSLGQFFSGTSIQVSATAGEAAVTTESAAGILLTQGFHQAEPEDLTSVHLAPEILAGLNAFPNPARGQFWVQVTSPTARPITVEVLDVAGRSLTKVVQTLPATIPTTLRLDSSSWPAGVYLVRLITQQGSLAGSLRMIIANQ